MQASFEASRAPNTEPKALQAYLGRYYSQLGDLFIDITPGPLSKGLQVTFQGLSSQVWSLKHYQDDTFLWLMSRNEAVSRARFSYPPEKL